MPSLGADMEAGTLVEWLKRPGDPVHHGDIVAVVETDKGAIDVEIFMDGVMGKQLVAPGTTVPVGTPLAVIEGAAEEAPQALSPAAAKEPATEPAMPKPVAPKAKAAKSAPPREGAVRASPAARSLAAVRHIALDTLRPSGGFFVKVFQGDMLDDFVKKVKKNFQEVRVVKPEASRGRSSELFILGLKLEKAG